ncbi:SH3 domain-binding protein 2-like [Mizuhopecten yessoensis]|uniref:SH3 domain-binding protein 2 n=1 Tax=Mizuhopecten yessoensis TaxID=6573 RepID=A0A210QVT2_MIZYE|nr:SH3 domain-binding protein 2-like [Mizuhopecten yessoensis]OWF52786.1 SH3 domain-binding protein 2 [Mizuhopecten yessoensis]
MSGDGSIVPSIFLEPQTTIGAQDILRLGVKLYGFLRKRGQLERTLQRVPVLKLIITKWRQKFVVIAKGCLYIYNDEFSTSPFQSVSLRGYDKVVREIIQDSDRMKSFKLYSKEQFDRKQFTFGSASEDDRKKWMKLLKAEMVLANEAVEDDEEHVISHKQSHDDEPEDEYTYLEKQVNVKEYPPILPHKPIKTTNRKKQPEPDSDTESDDYDKITEAMSPGARGARAPLPPIPKSEPVKKKEGPPMRKPKKPVPAEKPLLKRDISREDFEYKSSDRIQAQNILSGRDAGTYLVRQSRANDSEVLSVQTVDGMKEFKIFRKDGQFSIDHKVFFNSLELLLQHFSKADLPNRHDSLSRGYSCTDLTVAM